MSSQNADGAAPTLEVKDEAEGSAVVGYSQAWQEGGGGGGWWKGQVSAAILLEGDVLDLLLRSLSNPQGKKVPPRGFDFAAEISPPSPYESRRVCHSGQNMKNLGE